MMVVVLFCAKQETPLYRENLDALNKGNFLELLDLVSKYDPEIKRRLDELSKNVWITILGSRQRWHTVS